MSLLKDFLEFRRQKAAIEKRTVEDRPSQLVEWQKLAEWLGVADVSEDALSEATYFACMKVLSESVGTY